MGKYASSDDDSRNVRSRNSHKSDEELFRDRSSSADSYRSSRKMKKRSRSRDRNSTRDKRDRSKERRKQRSRSRSRGRRSRSRSAERSRRNKKDKKKSRSRSRSASRKSKKKKSKRSRSSSRRRRSTSRSRRSPSESSTRSSFATKTSSRGVSPVKAAEPRKATTQTTKAELPKLNEDNFEESVARSRALDVIESEGFSLSSFSSSRTDKKTKEPEHSGVFNFGTQAEKSSMGESFAARIANLGKEGLLHPSLFGNQAAKEERWLKKLFAHRQKLASASYMKTEPAY